MNNITARIISGSVIVSVFVVLFSMKSHLLTLIAYTLISMIIVSEISFNSKIQKIDRSLEYIAYIYVCMPVLFLCYLFYCPDRNCNVNNIFFLSIITACVFDTAAYVGGKLIGGARIVPAISPSKTISGTCIGFLSVFCLYTLIIDDKFFNVFFVSLFVSCGAFFGDLLQSKFKRVLGIKDMGVLIPGHGGFGDRFDGVIGVMFVYILMYLSGYYFDIGWAF